MAGSSHKAGLPLGASQRKTLLRHMGIEHTKLSVKFQGLDVRLTGVSGNVIKDILA